MCFTVTTSKHDRNAVDSMNVVQKWKGRFLHRTIFACAKSVNRMIGTIAKELEQPVFLR